MSVMANFNQGYFRIKLKTNLNKTIDIDNKQEHEVVRRDYNQIAFLQKFSFLFLLF